VKTGELYPYLKMVHELESMTGLQARMPYSFKFN
jgi:hypothetical protein